MNLKNMVVTIKSVTPRQAKDNRKYFVVDAGQSGKLSVWPDERDNTAYDMHDKQEIREGCKVEYQYEESGQYRNVAKAKILELATTPAKPQEAPQVDSEVWERKDRRITRNSAQDKGHESFSLALRQFDVMERSGMLKDPITYEGIEALAMKYANGTIKIAQKFEENTYRGMEQKVGQ